MIGLGGQCDSLVKLGFTSKINTFTFVPVIIVNAAFLSSEFPQRRQPVQLRWAIFHAVGATYTGNEEVCLHA